MSTRPRVELFLSRFAEGEWTGVVGPWLREAGQRLCRSLVVAPTRGQTHALKRRCVEEGLPLLGVEFLTPGLARRRRGGRDDAPDPVRLLLLRGRIEARLAGLDPEAPERLLWRSLLSDLEAAIGDLDELLRAGFRPAHFPSPQLQELFQGLLSDLAQLGYAAAPLEDEAAALAEPAAGTRTVCDRLLILAGGHECRGEFFPLAALARRTRSVCVVVPEPEFRGEGDPSVAWVEMWQSILGVDAVPIDGPEPERTCEAVGKLWTGAGGDAGRAEVILARSRSQEMDLVAARICTLLAGGATGIAVVFPAADAAHELLGRILDAKGIPFADHLPAQGTVPTDVRLQSGLADFYAGGGRMQELLALWPLLHAQGLARPAPAAARRVLEPVFDDTQDPLLEKHLARLEAGGDDAREVARVARLLLPALPDPVTVAEALVRFEQARDALLASAPPGWAALGEFARRCRQPLPLAAVLDAVRGFLPRTGTLEGTPARTGFARVTLTTARRAAGVAWSDIVLVESNHEVWPLRPEPTCWLTDEARRELNGSARSRFTVGLASADQRAAAERSLYAALARDTRGTVTFSASEIDEEDPEARLAPNGWMERVLAAKGMLGAGGEFGSLRARARRAPGVEPSQGECEHWAGVWRGRRDPGRVFDAHFLAHGRDIAVGPLSAQQIEQAVGDPARVWFAAVLRVQRTEWRPFARARGRLLGDTVHEVLAKALRGTAAGSEFFEMAPRAEAQARLAAAIGEARGRWPSGRYWDSFALEAAWAAQDLLSQVYGLGAGRYAAVEARIHERATVPAGVAGRIQVRGRMDLVLSDRPGWGGARVAIVDYKTGGDERVSAQKMASRSASLQLGVYLEAAVSLGAGGAVWMLKPGQRPSCLSQEELPAAQAGLSAVGRHLESGVYGALTPDRAEYVVRFEWPLACAPIAHAVLAAKYALTFGEARQQEDDGD